MIYKINAENTSSHACLICYQCNESKTRFFIEANTPEQARHKVITTQNDYKDSVGSVARSSGAVCGNCFLISVAIPL